MKYVDIVTDTLHASSSDLIVWNTLVMMKLKWINETPKEWIDITYNSLSAWEARDQLSQFHDDNRRGYARVTPIALSSIGIPNSRVQELDQYPTHGPGIYDDYEVCEEFQDYVWASWTTMEAQPMQVDPALQVLIDQAQQKLLPKYDQGASADSDMSSQLKSGGVATIGVTAPFPNSSEDVLMESTADKRSRESPDSTLKPEGKSLKTSESTSATPATVSTEVIELRAGGNVKPSNVSKRPKTPQEAKALMRDVHQRMPAWKAEKLITSNKDDQVDLAALGEATGILFESREMLRDAVQCLESLRNEKDEESVSKSDLQKSTDPQPSANQQNMTDVVGSSDPEGKKVSLNDSANNMPEGQKSSSSACDADKQDDKPPSKESENSAQQKDASASKVDQESERKTEAVQETHEDWFNRVINEGHEVLKHPLDTGRSPTLLTGMRSFDLMNANTTGWEGKLETANLEKHAEFLRERQFAVISHPLEATAWEGGYVPEAKGLPSDELELRILPLLPQLSHMVSAPRQPITSSIALLTRFDANIRPYWLRDWQSDFGGYTKVYEYEVDGELRRKYSVAHVIRPRAASENACLCFTLMSKPPVDKPWKRPVGQKDPSRSIVLDLREAQDWRLPATVLPAADAIAESLTEDMQVQCLPVSRSSSPKWMYRTLPKVTNFRYFGKMPVWCRRPQEMTYHLCAEDIAKTFIVPSLPEDEKEALLKQGVLPVESSARDRHCVMCPVKRGSPKLIPCCLCRNWRHPGCSYQTHLGRVCPCHVQILDPKRKIIVLRHPYHEDLVVLPTRPNIRVDNKAVTRDISYRPQPVEVPTRWCPSLWMNTLLEKHAWLSAGLVWMHGASQSANAGVYTEVSLDTLEPRPTISLFESWEEGAHLPVAMNARDYAFPNSLVIPFVWNQSPESVSLFDAINNVSSHGERRAWGQASLLKLNPGVNYPDQPRRNPDSHLSDPLTYWWGVTLCPPELNDVALAETVVIKMRMAAIREIYLNTEVNKPSLAEVLEYRGLRIERSAESTPHERACIYSSAYDGGKLLPQFGEPVREATEDEKTKIYTRSHGEFAATANPWPRKDETETKTMAEVKRRPYPTRGQGNRWDQYGEPSSSATSSEAHGMSDSTYVESTWGPCESVSKSQRAAQPYRLQKANRSDGQWSR